MRVILGAVLIAGLSGPVLAAGVSGADWGARDPLACAPLQQAAPPSPEQVGLLVQCERESASTSSGELRLIKAITVQVGKPMPGPEAFLLYSLPEVDVAAPVYPLRGAMTWSVCMTSYSAGLYGDPGLNCREYDIPQAKGMCWTTSFGDWRCTLSGDTGEQRDLTAPLQ